MSSRLVVEADGGSRGNPGPAAYGAVVQDATSGEVLAEVAEAIGVASNNVAEYRGLVAGLQAATAVDPDCTIEVRMDSKLVVEQMSGRWKVRHEDMRRLATVARGVVDPARVRYTWIPRELNKAADRLANEAMDDAARGLPWRGRPDRPVRSAQVQPARPDTGAPTSLVLLRHGVTEHTRARRFSGAGGEDPPLTDLGRRQAQAAAEALAVGAAFDAVLCSGLLRARQTAQVVAELLGLPVREDDSWAEMSFGSWDGLTSAQVAERWPDEHRAWQASASVAPPGGESLDTLQARVQRARDQAMARHPRGTVLVVTHAGPVKALATAAAGVGPPVSWRMESSPASLTRTQWWTDGHASLLSFNETVHLVLSGVPLR